MSLDERPQLLIGTSSESTLTKFDLCEVPASTFADAYNPPSRGRLCTVGIHFLPLDERRCRMLTLRLKWLCRDLKALVHFDRREAWAFDNSWPSTISDRRCARALPYVFAQLVALHVRVSRLWSYFDTPLALRLLNKLSVCPTRNRNFVLPLRVRFSHSACISILALCFAGSSSPLFRLFGGRTRLNPFRSVLSCSLVNPVAAAHFDRSLLRIVPRQWLNAAFFRWVVKLRRPQGTCGMLLINFGQRCGFRPSVEPPTMPSNVIVNIEAFNRGLGLGGVAALVEAASIAVPICGIWLSPPFRLCCDTPRGPSSVGGMEPLAYDLRLRGGVCGVCSLASA